MIYLKNQWVCKFDIANFKDFIYVEDFIEMLYVEDTAMTLPILELKFIIRDEKLLDYLNEGSVLTVGFGKDEITMKDLKFRIVTLSIKEKQGLGWMVDLGATYYNYEFLCNIDTITYPDMSSVEVVTEEASRYFDVKTNLDKTNDHRTWHKHENAWQFLREVCSKGYINKDTYLIAGFDSNTFYYLDYKKHILDSLSNPAIKIFSKDKAGKNFINFSNEVIETRNGITSKVLGNHQATLEYNWEDYSIRMYQDNKLSFSSIGTNKLPISDTGNLSLSYSHKSSTEKEINNFAKSHNAKNSILTSNVKIYISLGGQMSDLKLFDIVLIDESADRRIVGLSMVSRIAYQITKNQFYTNVTLVRESFNDLKGEELM